MNNSQVESLIKTEIIGAEVTVTGTDCSVDALVISEAFEGMGLLQRQRLVMAAVKSAIESGELHAISIKAYTPAQWLRKRADMDRCVEP